MPRSSSVNRHGLVLILVAALLWSTSGFFGKAPILDQWSSEVRGGVLAFWRSVFALALLLPMVRKPRWTWKLIPMATAFAGMNWTYLSALVQGPAANAIWLQNLAPGYVLVIGIVFLGERATRRDMGMLVCCALGVGLILSMELSTNGTGGAKALMLALASGSLYAAVIFSLRWLRDEDSAWLISVNHFVTALLVAPIALRPERLPIGYAWPLLAAFGMFQMGLSYLLFAKGLRSTSGHIAAFIGLIEPILLPVWVWLAWRHSPGYLPTPWWTIVGGGLILTGLAIRFAPLRATPSDR